MPSLVATTSALARKPCVSMHYVRTKKKNMDWSKTNLKWIWTNIIYEEDHKIKILEVYLLDLLNKGYLPWLDGEIFLDNNVIIMVPTSLLSYEHNK